MDLLDLVLHYDCNLRCSYCTITDEMRARAGVPAQAVGAEIERAARGGCRAVQFTGGEPTLRPDLLPLIRFAKSRGYTDIKVQTNGHLFATARNLERAIDAGVSRVAVSVHGFDPRSDEAYDAVVGAPGANGLLLAAIDNIVASSARAEVDLILMRSTLEGADRAVRALATRGVEVFNLWFVSLTDRNSANVDQLPTLRESADAVRRCLAVGREVGVTVRSLHVPRCLLPGDEACVAHPGADIDVRVVTPDAVFDLRKSRLSGGVKADACGSCRWDAVCPGVRADYVAVFGLDELVAVPPQA